MKLRILSLTFSILAMLVFHKEAKSQAFFGIYGGLNQGNMSMKGYKPSIDPMDLSPKFENMRRLAFGVNCELPLSDYFIFQPEIGLVQRGSIVSRDTGYSDITGGGYANFQTVSNLTLNYVQVPLLIKWRIQLNNPKPIYPHENSAQPWFLDIYAGPAFNYLVTNKSVWSYTSTEIAVGATEDEAVIKQIKGEGAIKGLKAIDVSAMAGISLRWRPSKKWYIWLDGRYAMNFLDINDKFVSYQELKESNIVTRYPTLKNSGNMTFTVGVSTTFTKRRYWEHPRMKNRKF